MPEQARHAPAKLAGHAYSDASAQTLVDGATARHDGALLDARTPFTRFEFKVSGRAVH